jgi:hypothetical protein
MKNFTKIKIMILWIVFLGAINCFAGLDDQQGVNDPVFAQMDRDQNAFLSKAELQAYQADQFSKMDKDNNGLVSAAEYATYYNTPQ